MIRLTPVITAMPAESKRTCASTGSIRAPGTTIVR